MSTCFKCNVELNELNRSVEHIIPNAVGGRLKSKDLLCQACNTQFGKTLDTEVTKDFSGIATLLNINRERNDVPPVEGLLPDNTKILISPDGKPSIKNPEFSKIETSEGTQVHFSARNEEEMTKFIKGFCTKHPHFEPAQLVGLIQRSSGYLNDKVKVQFKFGGNNCFRGILKIALEFRLLRVGRPSNLSPLIQLLMSGTSQLTCVFYSHDFDPFGADKEDVVTHSISLVGSKAQGLVYAHVVLFSFFRAFVILEETYDGVDFAEAYIQNAITGKEIPVHIHRTASRNEIEARRLLSDWPPRCFESELNRVVGVGMAAKHSARVKDLFTEVLDRWGKKYDNLQITQEMRDELINDYRAELEKFLSR
jgi:hypothetical protein